MEAQPGGGRGGGGGGRPVTPETGRGGGGAGVHEEEAVEDKARTDCIEGKTTGTAPIYENKRQVDLYSYFSPSSNILTIHLFRLLKAGLSPAGCSSSVLSGDGVMEWLTFRVSK